MIEIRLAPQEAVQNACTRLGCSVAEARLFVAEDAGSPQGSCLVLLQGETGQAVMEIEPRSFLYDGLLRTALYLMLQNGVKTAAVTGAVNAPVLKRLGFEEKNEMWSGKLTPGIFECCGHKES